MKVSLAMLLKTRGEKMSAFSLATMLMKLKGLYFACHDVYDNTGDSHCGAWRCPEGTLLDGSIDDGCFAA
jgi:hypothetical protein